MPRISLLSVGVSLFVPRTRSLGLMTSVEKFFRPSSTSHLALTLELCDLLQDPDFRIKRPEFAVFDDISNDVAVTRARVVEGFGVTASRNFQAGEVAALYPIHAIGYANGPAPATVHPLSSRVYGHSQHEKRLEIVGGSDLVYFKNEAYFFGAGGAGEGDFSFSIDDPSGKYVFDVNPDRRTDRLFVGHLVNDAASANFDTNTAAPEAAVSYLKSSLQGINVVMTPFGPAPLMAYVTTRPVNKGEEFLGSYGLDYWLSKVGNL
jgi:hypothetical protein